MEDAKSCIETDGMGLNESSGVVVVLDYGSQYTQLIARRARELGVNSIILNGSSSTTSSKVIKLIEKNNTTGGGGICVVLSGGPNSVHNPASPDVDDELLRLLEEQQIPVLGICYGMQLLVWKNGGEVQKGGMILCSIPMYLIILILFYLCESFH